MKEPYLAPKIEIVRMEDSAEIYTMPCYCVSGLGDGVSGSN